jgi:hypothetical protein
MEAISELRLPAATHSRTSPSRKLKGWRADSRKELTAGFGNRFRAATLLGSMEGGHYYPLTRTRAMGGNT